MSSLDMDAAYTVVGWPGVAFRIVGFPRRWEPYTALGECDSEYCDCHHGEWVEDHASERIIVCMVGDDRRNEVDIDDLSPIEEADYCGCCGQVGCAWGNL